MSQQRLNSTGSCSSNNMGDDNVFDIDDDRAVPKQWALDDHSPGFRTKINNWQDGFRLRSETLPASAFSSRNTRFHRQQSSDEFYVLREFSLSSKGLLKRGDSVKRRRTHSINSDSSVGSCHSVDGDGSNTGDSFSLRQNKAVFCNVDDLAKTQPVSDDIPSYKVAIVGDEGVGKTALSQQFTSSGYVDTFDTDPNDSCEVIVSISLDGEESELRFYNSRQLARQPEPEDIDAYVVVYALSDRPSYAHAEDILRNLRHSESRTCPTILVGNKNDLVRSRLVSADDGKLIATLYDAKYIETSAVLKHQVDELLVGILTHLKQRTGDGERKLKRGTSAKKFFRRILSFDCSEPSDCEITYG